MAMSLPPLETRFSPLTCIVRRRLLPVPGDVLVHMGERVGAEDVVARALVPGQLYAIDVAQELGVGVRSVPRYMRVGEGETVAAGETLASLQRFGMRMRVVEAPCAGNVQGIADGRIFFQEEPQPLRLRAYVPGEIIEEYPQRGVAIRARGCLVRGVWGTGGESQGLLATVVSEPGDTLTWDKVDPRYRGTILVGGFLDDPTVLSRAQQFRIHGLILGSMLPSLRPLCEGLSLSVVVTEGMGYIPMAGPIYECLRSHHGHLAVISGADRQGHSEVIVPSLEDEQDVSPATERPIEVGAQVRITRPPYLGLIGRVIGVSTIPQAISIGVWAEGADVRLQDGRRVFVPYANMELLG